MAKAESEYLKIAKAKIVTARTVPKYPKILIYGRKKQGKSTLALTAAVRSKLLVIDPEKGVEYKTHYNPYIWPVSKWEDMQEVKGALLTGKLSPDYLGLGKEKEPFQWVVPDGMTRINNFALNFVRKVQEERDLDRQPGFVQQRDYNKSGELMKQLLADFHALPMGVIYTAHERMKTIQLGDNEEDIDDEGEVQFVPELPDGVRNAVSGLVDVVGRIYTVRTEIKGNTVTRRRLRVGVHDRYDTGARTEYEDLPDVIKSPTIPKLLELMATNGKG